jgi:hypothetical protein
LTEKHSNKFGGPKNVKMKLVDQKTLKNEFGGPIFLAFFKPRKK